MAGTCSTPAEDDWVDEVVEEVLALVVAAAATARELVDELRVLVDEEALEEALEEAAADEVEADDDDPEAVTAETSLPLPQGIEVPSGCLVKGGDVVCPLALATAKRVVQVGSWPEWVN